MLWDFCTTAINLLQFYKQLLASCEYVDQINPNPQKEVVAYPERCDGISNQPLSDFITDTKEDSSQTITFSETPKKPSPLQPRKRSAGKKRPLSKPLPQSDRNS